MLIFALFLFLVIRSVNCRENWKLEPINQRNHLEHELSFNFGDLTDPIEVDAANGLATIESNSATNDDTLKQVDHNPVDQVHEMKLMVKKKYYRTKLGNYPKNGGLLQFLGPRINHNLNQEESQRYQNVKANLKMPPKLLMYALTRALRQVKGQKLDDWFQLIQATFDNCLKLLSEAGPEARGHLDAITKLLLAHQNNEEQHDGNIIGKSVDVSNNFTIENLTKNITEQPTASQSNVELKEVDKYKKVKVFGLLLQSKARSDKINIEKPTKNVSDSNSLVEVSSPKVNVTDYQQEESQRVVSSRIKINPILRFILLSTANKSDENITKPSSPIVDAPGQLLGSRPRYNQRPGEIENNNLRADYDCIKPNNLIIETKVVNKDKDEEKILAASSSKHFTIVDPNEAVEKITKKKFTCIFDGFFADVSTDCRTYFQCHQGLVFTFKCPTGTRFDEAGARCDWPDYVNCGSIP